MEVTSINHHDTHAVIGGGKVQAFTINADAEFFEMMSSTIYSNKKLAVVREVLCNAWDANIESQNQKKPVLVDISDAKMTFRDFGPGIDPNRIGEIYCSYGKSTKRHDGVQTGGFGIGSKAPFAYTKNFSVTTIHKGTKSVFNISRGSTATNGLPDFRCMVSVPTTEPDGLIVSIPIQKADRKAFQKLVVDLAFMGGILVRLNGQIQKRVVYGDQLPFALVPSNLFPEHLNAQVSGHSRRSGDIKYFVKYGSVVYPLPQDFTKNRHITVETGTQLIKSMDLSVVFIAPPNSIGITPSRENIEMLDRTVDTLKALFTASNAVVKELMPKVIQKLLPTYKESMRTSFNVDILGSDTLFKMVGNPLLGYESWCYAIKERQHISKPLAVVNNPDSLLDHLHVEYAYNGWGHKEIAALLYAEDPTGEKILSRIKKKILKNYPLYGEKLFKVALEKGNVSQLHRELRLKMADKLKRMMIYIEKTLDTSRVTAQINGWSSDTMTSESIERLILESTREKHISHRLNRIIEKFLEETHIPHMGHLPILLAQSVASVERVYKGKSGIYDAHILILVRKKKDYEVARKLLVDTMKLKNVHLIPELDLLMKPEPVLKKQYLLQYTGNQAIAVERKDEDCKYFIFTPNSYMIPGLDGTKLNQKKINLDATLGRLLCYLYPNAILVPGVADATALEAQGMKNVLEVLADDVEAYFSDSRNHELLLINLENVQGYFRSYQLNSVLRFLTPTALLEVLGRKPQYLSDNRELPTVIHTFFYILAKQFTPKYGFQYVHRAASKTQNIFDAFFGDEVRKIVDDPLMQVFCNHLPNSHEAVKDEQKSVFQAAIAAAMQTVRLHQNLRKKAPR